MQPSLGAPSESVFCRTASKNGLVKQAYHHKDLRNALVDEALRVLASDGPSALTLRELARRLGVTHAAPYAHFADKGALLEAVANVGFARLGAALAGARDAASEPAAAFRAMAHAYVDFACASPDLYRVMFADPALLHNDEHDMSPEGELAFGALVEAVVALGTSSEDDARVLSVVAWAMVHGIAMLEIDRRVSGKMLDRCTAELIDRSTGLFVAGLRGETPGQTA